MFSLKFLLLVVPIDAVLYLADQANHQDNPQMAVLKTATSTFQDGNIVLGGLFPVHSSAKDARCGELRSRDVVHFTQAMILAIDEVNSNSNLLPNVSLGFKIFDYCSKDVIALEKASTFLNTCHGDNKTRSSPVVGVVGPYSSSVTMQVSNLLGLFKIPHISYGATSPLLSDKDRFKFFLRTVPSDKTRALAIAESLRLSGTTYVSLLYSDDDFGRGGAKCFTQEAKEKKICIAVSKEISSEADITEAVEELVRKKEAKVVVLFCSKSQLREVFRTAKALGHADTFLWLVGGDSSETHIYLNDNEEMADKVIIFAPRSTISPALESWKGKLNDSRNPWVKEMKKQNENKGLLPFDSGDRRKDGAELVHTTDKLFLTTLHLQNVVIAVNTFAHALDNILRTLCANGSTKLIPCIQKEASDGKQLLHFIKSASFKTRGRKVKFEENGDMCAEYELLRPLKRNCTDMWGFTKVGKWKHFNIRRGIGPEIPQDVFPRTSCALPCGVGEVKILLDNCSCWRCSPCKENEITVKANTECKPCPEGSKVNADRSSCMSLPTLSNDPEAAVITVTVCSVATGLLCSLLILVVFVFHKDNPIIKASSRGLSCVLLCGVMLSCCGSLLEIFEPNSLICTLKRYGCLGYIMCYDVMFCKALRLNRLFNKSLRFSMNPTLVSTRSQLLLIGAIWGVAALLATMWGFYSFKDSVITIYTADAVVTQCKVTDLEFVMGVSCKLLLLSLCAFYSFKTRKLPKQFRETKELSVSIYGTATVELVALATVCSLPPEHVLRGRVILVSKPILALFVLVPIFLPKMYGVFCHPEKISRTGTLTPKRRSDDKFEIFFKGETNAPGMFLSQRDSQLIVQSHNLIQGGNESLHRRSVCSADTCSRNASDAILRSSEKVPGILNDPICTSYRPRSDTEGYLQKESTPTSMDSVYSTWL